MDSNTLKTTFDKFTTGSPNMDGQTFSKFCKDSGLYDKQFTTTDADLIFAQVKGASTVRNITFAQYENGVQEIATQLGIPLEDLKTKISTSNGPVFSGTKTDNVKFHDDPTQYTGTHKGKETGKIETGTTAPVHVTTSTKTTSSVTKTSDHTKSDHTKTEQKQSDPQKEEKKEEQKKEQPVKKTEAASSLDEVFQNFTGGAAEMEGKTFAKVIQDSGLLDKKLTNTDVDLIFTKVKKTDRKIKYDQFADGLQQCADQQGISLEDLTAKVLENGGPVLNATKTDNVKFHDDQSLYTGVHAQGGPTTVDNDQGDLSKVTNRAPADVRGVAQK